MGHSIVDKNIVGLQVNELISIGGKSGSFIFLSADASCQAVLRKLDIS